MTTKELITFLRVIAPNTGAINGFHEATLLEAADMLESQFLAAERDAEAIRQLRQEIADGNAMLGVGAVKILDQKAALAAAKDALESCQSGGIGQYAWWKFDFRLVASALAKINALSP